jgi:hypothetical protein
MNRLLLEYFVSILTPPQDQWLIMDMALKGKTFHDARIDSESSAFYGDSFGYFPPPLVKYDPVVLIKAGRCPMANPSQKKTKPTH